MSGRMLPVAVSPLNFLPFPLMKLSLLLASVALACATPLAAQPYATSPLAPDKFRQLEEILPTPNAQRTASGAPGHAYWQQRADYVIDATLDDAHQTLTGRATITYSNHSPDALSYLWVQLDQNILAPDSDNHAIAAYPRATPGANPFSRLSYQHLDAMLQRETYASNLQITAVTDATGQPLPHTVVRTMMRIDLPVPLAAGAQTKFSLAWSFQIGSAKLYSVRSGWEYFPRDQNYLYLMGQWFPRMAAYTDTTGWQLKQYLGRGEFTLEFGDYLVRLTVPSDHIVSATGALQNPAAVLTPVQRERLQQAAAAQSPVFIVTPEEAKKAEAGKSTGTKTWVFHAENVRDFAFASSRKFIWDAMGVPGFTHPPTPVHTGGIQDLRYRPPVMAMSFYPNEAEPLWSKYSTAAIVHTITSYSQFTFPYPYPVAQSVNGPVLGMEYPMICFNSPRPEIDGTYAKKTKFALIGVVIHEVGHNYFPMIVNSDERQWGWMDEGLNSFLEYLAEQTWSQDFPSRRGEPRDAVAGMKSGGQRPIMTSVESINQNGFTSYTKTAAALNLLRETVLGRALFDHAFRTYAQRWQFKRAYPADFFRTMEDASGIDLDWFWRGWFYTTDHVDVALNAVQLYTLDTRDPAIEKPRAQKEKAGKPATLSQLRDADRPKYVDAHPELEDFYTDFDEATVLPGDQKKYADLLKALAKAEIDPALLKTERNFYLVELSNLGGLISPVILKVDYTDGSTVELRLPAEIWLADSTKTRKLILTTKTIQALQLDPHEETADTDVENNFWPRRVIQSRFELFQTPTEKNPMQELKPAADETDPPAGPFAPAPAP